MICRSPDLWPVAADPAELLLPNPAQSRSKTTMRSLFRRSSAPEPSSQSRPLAPAPDQPVFVVGDVHGCADLMERLLHRIDTYIEAEKLTNPLLAFVGDLVDFGPESRIVLNRLQGLSQEFPNNFVCLMGNHERMLLDFLDQPERKAARWLRAGGPATLASFGLLPPADKTPEAYHACAQALSRAMGSELVGWLRSRPLSWQSGSLWVVHAAADPRVAMPEQSDRVLLWGHPEFEVMGRKDGAWVAHGHHAVETPVARDGRISVDTGAWETGRLTAAAIQPGGLVEMLTVEA